MAVFFCISLSLFFFLTNAARNVLDAGGGLPPANSPPPYGGVEPSPFKPSVVVVVGVLTTVFSITFLILLYAKHCKRVTVTLSDEFSYSYYQGGVRKNSGVDRGVIESLPIFRFRSLIGEKEGLECAVCLTRFEPSELLRLLPKCKHAFHVECVDTWLDAHSTCPLCRYRVDPEDVLLLDQSDPIAPPPQIKRDSEHRLKRVLGRHSSAGPGSGQTGSNNDPASFRRSLDSLGQKKRSESVAVGCFDRGRKDGLLLNDDVDRRRFEHRIVVSGRNSASGAQEQQRWSDVQPLDLLYLRSEMIISESRSRGSQMRKSNVGINGSGRNVINGRSVSEITGLDRFSRNRQYGHGNRAGVILMSRWLASQSRPHDSQDVRPGRTSGSGSGPGSGPGGAPPAAVG